MFYARIKYISVLRGKSMGNIILTTESGTDLSREHAKELGIRVIPMYVALEGGMKADGLFPVTEVFEYYHKTKKIPTTSAVNPDEYIAEFRDLRDRYPDADIVHIAYTSLASCTYRNAALALEELGDPKIFLIDSLNVSGGISLICEKAVELAKAVSCGAELKEKLEPWIRKARVTFLPDTLEYLRAGGRVSNAVYLGGTLLNIKPQIVMKEGRLVASKKYRGKMEKVAFRCFDDFIAENDLDRSLFYLFYVEGLSREILDELRNRAKKLGFEKILETKCGCVITCHGGPGAVGFAAFAKEE